MGQVKVLFVRNLQQSTSENDLRELFESLVEGQIERVKKSKDYAFIHFCSREAAEQALSEASKPDFKIDGAEVEVTWSKPVDKQIYNTRKHLTKLLSGGNNFRQQQPQQHPFNIQPAM